MRNKDWYLFYINQATGSNVRMYESIMAHFSDPGEVYELAKKRADAAFKPLGQAAARKLIEFADEALIDARLEWLKKQNVNVIPLGSDEYPYLLSEIKNPPSMLYVKGKLVADMELPIAIIGMRRYTPYGEAVTNHLSCELVKHGSTIISGMALGIDACAARAALSVERADNPTVAVLGSGIDVIYPADNARLYGEIAERGAVITEFLPGTRPYRDNFPVRNRIISGLARGVVVVEAGSRSGTTITAGHALDQGRDVFAVPGRITDETSFGTNRMIQRGEAKPVFCAADILLEYGVDPGEDINKRASFAKPDGRRKHEPKNRDENPKAEYPQIKAQEESGGETKARKAGNEEADKVSIPDLEKLSPVERQIVEQLIEGQKNADELCDILSIDAAAVNSSLTSLQFSGIIKQLPGRLFGL